MAASIKNIDTPRFKRELEDMLKQHGVPSVTIGVTVNGETSFFTAGMSDVEAGKAPNEHTVYQIGSLTKSFTAAAVALLADEGKLELDAPLFRYIPELEFKSPELYQITLRDALSHRTGLDDYSLAWRPFLDEYDDAKLISLVRHYKPVAPIRTKMIYTNTMYMLAGRAIERVSGMNYADFIRSRLLAPLGMTETYLDPLGMPKMENVSKGYSMIDGKLTETPYCFIHSMSPSGSMASTASDLMKWLAFQLSQGIAGDKRIVSESALGECHYPQIPIPRGRFEFFGVERIRSMSYGMGWYHEDYAGYTVLQHGGNIDGYSASLAFAPYDGVGVAILTNKDLSLLSQMLIYHVMDAVLGLDYVDHAGNILKFLEDGEAKKPSVVELPAYTMEELSGEYSDAFFGTFRVFVENGTLRGKLGSFDAYFEHVSGGGYHIRFPSFTGDLLTNAVFIADINGHVRSLLVTYDMDVEYKKAK